MKNFDRSAAIDALANYYLDGMDYKCLTQMAYEVISDGMAQETDADLMAQLTQHGLIEENENA